MRRSRFCRAFTLIELLVVIAIIGVLMALMLPAIQKVRGAAERIRCSNQMRQIGVALIRYHDERGALPMGTTPAQKKYDFPLMYWLARLLPYIEQDALWQQSMTEYRAYRNPIGPGFHKTNSAAINLYFCPSDPRGIGPHTSPHKYVVGVTSYVGVNGTDHTRKDGVFYRASTTRFDDIADGTSHTLLVGERPPAGDFSYGWWYAGVGMLASAAPDSLLGVREIRTGGMKWCAGCPTDPRHYQAGSLDELCDLFHFWSFHSGGGNFLMCDGSVHFLTYYADKILPALATRAGGEEATPN